MMAGLWDTRTVYAPAEAPGAEAIDAFTLRVRYAPQVEADVRAAHDRAVIADASGVCPFARAWLM